MIPPTTKEKRPMDFTDDDLRALAMTYALRGYLNDYDAHGVASLARDAYQSAVAAGDAIIRAHGIDPDLFNDDPDLRDHMGARSVDTWIELLRETIATIERRRAMWLRGFRGAMVRRAAARRAGEDDGGWWSDAAREARDLYLAHGGR